MSGEITTFPATGDVSTLQATTLPLDAIQLGERHRKDLGDIDSLARSIADVGLHPVVVRPDGVLIAGARRIAACRRLGWSEVPVRIMETPDP